MGQLQKEVIMLKAVYTELKSIFTGADSKPVLYEYYKKFALFPIKIGNQWIWLKRYYEMIMVDVNSYNYEYEYKRITEAEYIILILQDKIYHDIDLPEL